jgi:hypothetical protein
MSAATLGTTAAVDAALRRGFSEASVRVAPEARMTDIVAALGAMGVTVELQDGVLVLAQSGTEMHTTKALRNFSQRPEHANFFVQEGAHPSQWSTKKKVEFLSAHTDDEYRALVQSPVLEAGIRVLDPNMAKADYLNLTRAERVRFITEYGDDAVRHILGKAK